MRRAAFLALLALALVAGTARADVFQVVPPPAAVPEQPDEAQLLALWQGAGAEYGVPWQVLAAINKVESNFGRNMGPSSAGAIGWMQFMPGTWMEYGTDANGDGVADPWNATDAIYSAARYLAANGASADLYGSIYQYNHADWYVREVLGLAQLYGADAPIAFSLDRLQQQLDAARQSVASAGDRLQAATRAAASWQRRAESAALLSTRLDLQRRATLAAIRRDLVARQLAQAKRVLAKAQRASQAAAFDSAAGALLGAPTYSSGYVFPVGGGPGIVTASHTHHDYPAVDIQAPLGEPEYALADSVVLNVWRVADPSCGLGLTLRAFDGQVWTYCHMAVVDPVVQIGAALTAGEQVGLVGETGDASGPHLHLQLQPATVWPQSEDWFQSFAGTAYSWRDGSDVAQYPAATAAPAFRTEAAVRAAPVFQVVPAASEQGVVLFSRG